jgi:hypothetical protein
MYNPVTKIVKYPKCRNVSNMIFSLRIIFSYVTKYLAELLLKLSELGKVFSVLNKVPHQEHVYIA